MQRSLEILLHLLAWSLLWMLTCTLQLIRFEPLSYESGTMLVLVTGSLLVNSGVVYAVGLVLLPLYFAGKRRGLIGAGIGAVILVGALLKWLLLWLLLRTFHPESDILAREPILSVVPIFSTSIFAILGATYRFGKDWVVNEALKRVLIHEKTAAELGYLKSQINPHFLFNTLNNLYGMARREKAEKTSESILKLADMMRYMLYESREAMLPLRREIEYLQSYIDLQRLRIASDRVAIQFEFNGPVDRISVHPLLLVPLVENAFKHGISQSKASSIEILLQADETGAWFSVKNTIHRQSHRDPEAGGLGLDNLERRLELLVPGGKRLQTSQKGGMFEAILDIPCKVGLREMHRN